MEIPRARSIDELYGRVEDHDLVLTADAPLADALTARVETSRMGTFATTPRRLVRSANRNEDLLERRDLFVETVNRTDLDWNRASHAIDTVLDCWTHTGDATGILDHARYDTDAVRMVLDIIRDSTTLYGAMQAYRIDPALDVAVIGAHRFDALDRSILPEQHDTIDYLTGETHETPAFQIYRSRTDIVRAAVSVAEEYRPEDVAVVMDPESSYPALLEARLDTGGVPYMRERTLAETRAIRTLIMTLRRGFEDGLRVRDVRPLLPTFDLTISREFEKHRLDRVDAQGAETLRGILQDAVSGTFADAATLIAERAGMDMEPVRAALDDLSLLEREVSEGRLDRLAAYLAAYDDRVERSRSGVLLASATTAAYLDRPIVLYLGMDAAWTRDVPDRPWIDRERVEERHLTDFTTLLQNGEQQHVLVQDREMNRSITPCLYLNEFAERPIESFRDLPHIRRGVDEAEHGDGFVHRERDVWSREETAISQSRLSTFVTSPRDYYFDQLVEDVDEVYFTRGTLFHDFAEFAINHRSVVREEGVEAFVDIMLDQIRPHLEARQEPLYRTQFTVGCRSILAFLDQTDILTEEVRGYGPTPWDTSNAFADHFDLPITSPVAERWFQDEELGMQGIVDFIADRTHLVDHKSGGSTPSKQKLVQRGHVDRFEDDPDFQAPMYLTHHRSVVPDEPLTFTYFHFRNNEGDAVAGGASIEDNLGSVTYLPRPYEEQVTRQHAYDYLCTAKVRERLLEPLGPAGYRDAVGTLTIGEERWEKDAMVEEHLDAFVDACRPDLAVGRGEDVTENQLEKGARSVLKQLVSYRREHFFAPDLDRFEAFVRGKLSELNEYKQTRFPVGDADRDDMRHPDLVIR